MDARTTNRAYARKVGARRAPRAPRRRHAPPGVEDDRDASDDAEEAPSQPSVQALVEDAAEHRADDDAQRAERGDEMAGAKAYAAKLAASPTIIVHMPVHQGLAEVAAFAQAARVPEIAARQAALLDDEGGADGERAHRERHADRLRPGVLVGRDVQRTTSRERPSRRRRERTPAEGAATSERGGRPGGSNAKTSPEEMVKCRGRTMIARRPAAGVRRSESRPARQLIGGDAVVPRSRLPARLVTSSLSSDPRRASRTMSAPALTAAPSARTARSRLRGARAPRRPRRAP